MILITGLCKYTPCGINPDCFNLLSRMSNDVTGALMYSDKGSDRRKLTKSTGSEIFKMVTVLLGMETISFWGNIS